MNKKKIIIKKLKRRKSNNEDITFKVLIDSLGESASVFLSQEIKKLNISESDSVSKKWSQLYYKLFSKSILSLERQLEIIKQLPEDMKKYRDKKRKYLKNIIGKCGSLSRPSWWVINTTDSALGFRLCLGLKNVGCEYWQKSKDKVGCTNCGYFLSTVYSKKVTTQNMVQQFLYAISGSKKQKIKYDVIEFLNDGSFFNDKEVYPDTRRELFKIISKQKDVKRVAVETRPEYITEKDLDELVKHLRKDQSLEIAFGLETTDLFIQHFCINKGYGTKELGEALNLISKVNKKHRKDKIGFFSYVLVKAAYLTDKEAIEDAVVSGEYINKISKIYDFPICVKYEPVVIADGTLLEVLFEEKDEFDNRKFVAPSYWSILEIVARLVKLEGDVYKKVRIGSREDMDVFKDIPATHYKIGMLSRYDFIIYDAVQKYNQHHNISKMLSDIETALKDRSLEDWQNDTEIKNPVFISLFEKYREKIEEHKNTTEYKKRERFLNIIFVILDKIEYSEESQRKAREIWSKNLNKSKKSIKKYIEDMILIFIPEAKIEISNLEVLDYDLKLLRMQIKINYENQDYAIWIGIPTARRVKIEEVE
jgi:radical SAM enzyme (TIGR01210 family)